MYRGGQRILEVFRKLNQMNTEKQLECYKILTKLT